MLDYDFYENPPRKGWYGRKRLHARVVTQGTTGTDELAECIHDCSSLSTGDAKAALVAFTEVIIRELSYGRRIHLEGLGYFQLTLDCPVIYDRKEIRAESVRVKSVAFRPEVHIKKHFKAVQLKRVSEKAHSKRRTAEEIEELLTRYFQKNTYITSAEFCRLCGLTKSTAYRWLKKLLADGKLLKTGHAGAPLYRQV